MNSDCLYDFAEGKTPTNDVTLVEKYCCLCNMIYNKAWVLVKKRRRGGERQGKQLRRQITPGLYILSP